MSLRKVFRSRKFSKSFRELKEQDEDQGRGRRIVGDSAELDRIADGRDSSASWSTMLPELLGEIIQRVEASEDQWPNRQNVVACACVCKRWREITREIVRSPSHGGKITFPSCLKQVSSWENKLLFFHPFVFPSNFLARIFISILIWVMRRSFVIVGNLSLHLELYALFFFFERVMLGYVYYSVWFLYIV